MPCAVGCQNISPVRVVLQEMESLVCGADFVKRNLNSFFTFHRHVLLSIFLLKHSFHTLWAQKITKKSERGDGEKNMVRNQRFPILSIVSYTNM